jgi:pseudouridine kinase
MNLLEANHLAEADYKLDDQTLGKYFINKGVKEVYITKGREGSFYVSKDEFKEMKNKTVEIKNSAGAGDAYLAGVIFAKVNDLDPLLYGTNAALITLQDEKAVSQEMNTENIKEIN